MDASPASTDLREFVSFAVDHPRPKVSLALRILIVDHDERSSEVVNRQILSQRADSDDWTKCTGHGLDALVVAEEFQPELVIMHLGFPLRSGACTAKLLRRRPWAGQVVIVSHSLSGIVNKSSSDFDFHFYDGIDIPLLMKIYRNLWLRRCQLSHPDALDCILHS